MKYLDAIADTDPEWIQIIFRNGDSDWEKLGYIHNEMLNSTWKLFEICCCDIFTNLLNFDWPQNTRVQRRWNKITIRNTNVIISLPINNSYSWISVENLTCEFIVDPDYFSVSETGLLVFYPSFIQMRTNKEIKIDESFETVKWNQYVMTNVLSSKASGYLFIPQNQIQTAVFDCRLDIAFMPFKAIHLQFLELDLSKDYTEFYLIEKLTKKTSVSIKASIKWETYNYDRIMKNLGFLQNTKIIHLEVKIWFELDGRHKSEISRRLLKLANTSKLTILDDTDIKVFKYFLGINTGKFLQSLNFVTNQQTMKEFCNEDEDRITGARIVRHIRTYKRTRWFT